MNSKVSLKNLEEFEVIEKRFAESAARNFRDYLSLLISSGSFAYRGARKGESDLDVMAIFNERIHEVPREELYKMTEGFVIDYRSIHGEYGYKMDLAFPGEYITHANVEDAIAGRGFSVSEEGQIYLPRASNDYYLQDRENYYRAWRSMLAFSKRLYGDERTFEDIKIRSWESILLYLIHSKQLSEVSVEGILEILAQEDKWEGVGVTKKYLTFPGEEKSYVKRVLTRLKVRGLLQYNGAFYRSNGAGISLWQHDLAAEIKDGHIKKSKFLFSEEEENRLGVLTAKPLEQVAEIFETERYSASPMLNKFLGKCIQVVYTATLEECQEGGLTDNNIVIFIKIPQDPELLTFNGNKLFSSTVFGQNEVLLRVSSSCLHGSLGDSECNCYLDSINSMRQIGQNGCGIFIYMPQDALGRGLRDKVRDHRLIYGVDKTGKKTTPMTREQSLASLHPQGYDIRKFYIIGRIVEELGLSDLNYVLLGDNPSKIEKIQQQTGLHIVEFRSIDSSNP